MTLPLLVKSMNPKSGAVYEIDRANLTCSCPAFTYGMTRPCKHMKAALTPTELDKAKVNNHNDSLAKAIAKESGMGGLYTVGHSNYTTEYLINKMLKPHGITTVVDVRSTPFSRYNPQFNRPDLAATLYRSEIDYFYGGKTLGGKNGPSIETPAFKMDMEKVLKLAEHENVAMMCSERNPTECHRAYKLSAYVLENHPDVHPMHITKEGLLDGVAVSDSLPDSWKWHELGGIAT